MVGAGGAILLFTKVVNSCLVQHETEPPWVPAWAVFYDAHCFNFLKKRFFGITAYLEFRGFIWLLLMYYFPV